MSAVRYEFKSLAEIAELFAESGRLGRERANNLTLNINQLERAKLRSEASAYENVASILRYSRITGGIER